jgi:hypothetical protein
MVSQHNFNCFICGEWNANIHRVGNWSCPTFSLDIIGNRQIPWPCREENPNHQNPYLNHYTYTDLWSISILFFYLYLHLQSDLFPYTSHGHVILFDHLNNISWKVQIIKLLIIWLLSSSSYFFFVHYPQDSNTLNVHSLLELDLWQWICKK